MSGRVAVVFPLPLEPIHLGKDVFLIPEGLRRLGFEVELHTPEARGDEEWPVPVVEGPIGDASYWRGLSYDGAVVFSFLHNAPLLEAVRASGARVVAKGDTDGLVVAREHPKPTLQYAWFDSPSPRVRARSLAYWLARLGPLHRREVNSLLAAVSAADVTVAEVKPAREAVARVLTRHGAAGLADRLVVVPNPVGEMFTTPAVRSERDGLVVAIGRWDLAQKDAPLLADALGRFLAAHPDWRAVVVGRSGEAVFGGGERVEYFGQLPREEMAPLLGRARICVASSRWESFHLAAHESLAMGCTVVGPPLPAFVDIAGRGPYGTVAERRDADGLAAALAHEAAAWERGDRDPQQTAAFWRRRVSIDAVAERFADLLS